MKIREGVSRIANRAAIIGTVMLITASFAYSQEVTSCVDERVILPKDVPEFKYDVVSIKPHDPNDLGMTGGERNNGFSFRGIPLIELISWAYGVDEAHITGAPGWVKYERFDIEARVIGEASLRQYSVLYRKGRSAILQYILKDRFGLSTHMEARVGTVYSLGVSSRGSKLKLSSDKNLGTIHQGYSTASEVVLETKSATMADMADQISGILGAPVCDQTGLTEKYDIKLTYSNANVVSSTTATAPDIFQAVKEELGLKLSSGKGTQQYIVVDHIGKLVQN